MLGAVLGLRHGAVGVVDARSGLRHDSSRMLGVEVVGALQGTGPVLMSLIHSLTSLVQVLSCLTGPAEHSAQPRDDLTQR
nr:hypothetical protein GCM10020241_10620 [Streptoalloteichus tenebrarius]